MASRAVTDALTRAGADSFDFLAAATSQGDHPLPGFASFVHAELGGPPCEIATHHGVCVSGVAALKHATLQVESGRRQRAVACASEFASRLLKASRYEAQHVGNGRTLSFDSEFLRWMLSDGAGAAVLEPQPAQDRLSLKVEWIETKSLASRFPPCMYVGPAANGSQRLKSWLDYADYHQAANDGAINLRQDIRLLDDVVKCAVDGAIALAAEGRFNPRALDWLVAHYSSQLFLDQSYDLAVAGGVNLPRERWFSNLRSTGNVGSASIYLLLEELLRHPELEPGHRILCVVPESGRFQFGYMLLTVAAGEGTHQTTAKDPPSPAGRPEPPALAPHDATSQALIRQLTEVWFDFDARLQRVPIIQRLNVGRLTLDDYKKLLFNLRQQVIDGSRWISRAASNITEEYFPIRSAFIGHSQDEHRDYELLERDYGA